MNNPSQRSPLRFLRLLIPLTAAMLLAILLFGQLRHASTPVVAAPIDPPEGYPKFNQSSKVVSPTLAPTTGATLVYTIAIRNTGAYSALGVTMVDPLPLNVAYNNDAWASAGNQPGFSAGKITWTGPVGFDDTVLVTFSVNVAAGFSGVIENEAVIDNAQIPEPVTVTARTVVTDDPILSISKTALPGKPGANKVLTYTLEVLNEGQPATSLPITVSDQIPVNTTFHAAGLDGSPTPAGFVTFNRTVDLATGETSIFTFSVQIQDVSSGTVITNDNYKVGYSGNRLGVGEPYTTTVIDPILLIAKTVEPDPPGANREMTYTLTVLNVGSLATNLVITDRVPTTVTYSSGGDSYDGYVVSWFIPSLDTNESVEVQFVVTIGDIAMVPAINVDYGVCSSEDVCTPGEVLTSTIFGPSFKISGIMDPVAKKPGGGPEGQKTVVTPTLVLENTGPGSALDAHVKLCFGNISVSNGDVLKSIPPSPPGSFVPTTMCDPTKDPAIWKNNYLWIGDIAAGEKITFTTIEGQSTIGGDPNTGYTATLVVTDQLGSFVTEPISGSINGKITHNPNLIPVKNAPPEIGAGELLTYQINVFNSGLSVKVPPTPTLTETVPASATLVSVSDGGLTSTVNGKTTISWYLPAMGPGDLASRSFVVRVMQDLVSGTLLVNDAYRTFWMVGTKPYSITGEPITTVVKEVGLIDSYKTVAPEILTPGPDNVLTYTVHVVNSGPHNLSGVQVYDWLPWQSTTYQRDAQVSAGSLVSDIVSLEWTGNVAPYSEELITFSVKVDANFSGVISNTVVITHPMLRAPVVVGVPAYITDQPILLINKTATPDPVPLGDKLFYTIQVTNKGQQATQLVITDTIPGNVEYVLGSASSSGALVGTDLHWGMLLLRPGETRQVSYWVVVKSGKQVINEFYRVSCAEGVSAVGPPVITQIVSGFEYLYLPIVMK